MGNLLDRGLMVGGNIYLKPNEEKCLSQGKNGFLNFHGKRAFLDLKNETAWPGFFWDLTIVTGVTFVH